VLELALCSAIFAWLVRDVLQKGTTWRLIFTTLLARGAGRSGRKIAVSKVVDFYHLPFVYPAPAALLFARSASSRGALPMSCSRFFSPRLSFSHCDYCL